MAEHSQVFRDVGFFMRVSTVSSCREVIVASPFLMKERR
jgi:hypothetical protein